MIKRIETILTTIKYRALTFAYKKIKFKIYKSTKAKIQTNFHIGKIAKECNCLLRNFVVIDKRTSITNRRYNLGMLC